MCLRWGSALACSLYAIYIIAGAPDAPGWLIPLVACIGLAGIALIVKEKVRPGRLRGAALPVAVASCLIAPAVASALAVSERLGPFNAPFEATPPPVPVSAYVQETSFLHELSTRYPARYPLGTYASSFAAPWILASGLEILPIGGYFGGAPSPSLSQLKQDISGALVKTFLLPLAPYNDDPRILWIIDHCNRVSNPTSRNPLRLTLFHCQ